MITTVLAGISVCQIVPIEAEESTHTASVEEDTGTLNIEAAAPDDVLPKDAQLVVSPIKNDGSNSLYEDTLNKLNEQASKDKKIIDAFYAYDIQFEDNDTAVEPDDGFVSVSMKWDTALKPDGVEDDDKVSVIHLTSDDDIENLTDETDTDKNHGTVKMDDNDPEAVTEASIISNSFSVYALVWQRDDISSVNVHYVDENGNEISGVNTTDITQETGSDTLVQAIDGYTYAYASIDNVNVQSVNIDNGRLYFYDGINWNRASSDDVYLTYTVNPTEEVTEPESTSTPDVTEQPEETEAPVTPEATPEPEENTEKQLTDSTTDGKYNVTVTYGDDAGLPEGTSLSVKQIDEDNEEYANAKKAVSTATGVDTDDLDMAALDITLLDKDGNKVEPEDNSKVKVSITAEDLPDSVNSVDIHHITENENNTSDTTLLSKIAGLFKSNDKDTAETVKKNVTVTNGQAVTDFEVSSFSTFTITWTKGDGTRTGNVVIHYVSNTGLEKDVTSETVQTSDLSKYFNTPVDLTSSDSVWHKTLKADDDGTTYTFDHAAIGSRNGKTITGIKIAQGTEIRKVQTDYDYTNHQPVYTDVTVTNYKLYYTTDSNVSNTDNWILYRDSASNNTANNANIYMIYKSSRSDTLSTVHFHQVDKYGAKLADDKTWPAYNGTQTAYNDHWGGASNLQNNQTVNNIGAWQYAYIGYFGNETYKVSSGASLNYYYDTTNRRWHTGTGTGAGIATKEYLADGSTTGAVSSSSAVQSNPVLLTDVYHVYAGYKGVTIHYVDENGNELKDTNGTVVSNGRTYTPVESAIDGYTYSEARVDGFNGAVFTSITYTVDNNGDWTSSVNNNSDTVTTTENPVNDVYLVYKKNDSSVSKTLTAHYHYLSASTTSTDVNAAGYDDAYYRDGDGKKNTATMDITNNGEVQLVRHQTETNDYVFEDIVKDGSVKRAAKSGETGDSNGDMPLTYMNTHVGSINGPTVTSVELTDDDTLIYHTDFSGHMDFNSGDHEWTYTEREGTQKGRRFVLNVDNSGNPTLQDSQFGSIQLNYASEGGGSSSDGTQQQPTYTATFHGDKTTTEYTVYYTPAADNTTASYYLIVRDSFPSTNTDLYYTYVDDDENNGSSNGLYIDDDILYSGLFRVRLSDALSATLQSASNIEYRWYQKKVTTGATVDSSTIKTSPGTEVTWKQTGQHQNTAQNLENRVFLDIEADEGTDTWTYGTDVYYYVTLTYTPEGSDQSITVTSEPAKVGYYGQLENGDFEATVAKSSWKQSDYIDAGGVWKTTAPSATNKYKDPNGNLYNDIEIVYGTDFGSYGRQGLIGNYHWNGYKSGTNNNGHQNYSDSGDSGEVDGKAGWQAAGDMSATSWAQHGTKFAELNAEAAGALYQDVITHPNEELSYYFSHRARGSVEADKNNWHYDRMYLVIMPTKLAMTSGTNQTELTTQEDLKAFIQAHGGFDDSTATSKEDEITYSDIDNGILIRKVSSDESAWHTISSINSYIAKGGLTRFFFVAASECSDAGRYKENPNLSDRERFLIPTEGNFLDNVGFSQTLPTPEGFSLVASKTFTGLTQTQVADLASARTENGNTSTNSNPFTITITNTYSDGETNRTNDALSNAALHFTAVNTGSGTYTYTGTAVQYFHKESGSDKWKIISESDYKGHENDQNYKVVNLFDETDSNNNKKNTFSSRVNQDGSITMTWTFTSQSLPSAGSTALATDYTLREFNDDVSGYTTDQQITATNGMTWQQIAVGVMDSNYKITGSAINGNAGLTTVDTNTVYTPAEGVNFMVGQLSNGSRTGYLVWTHTTNAPGTDANDAEKTAIVNYINTLEWTKDVKASTSAGIGTDGHVEYRSGDNGGVPFAYDQTNPSLNITFVMNGNVPAVKLNNAVTTTGSSSTRTVHEGYVVRYNFTNTYTEKTSPQITVQKVFTGVTRTTVDDLLKGDTTTDPVKPGYKITLTKTNTDTGASISDQPSIELTPQTSSLNSNVTYSVSTDEMSGKITLTWVVKEIGTDTTPADGDAQMGGPGTYTVKEENYNTQAMSNGDNNVLQYVTVNGDSAVMPEDKTSAIEVTGVNTGNADSAPVITEVSDTVNHSDTITSGQTFNLNKSTNLIIAETNDGKYTVWTPETAGVNLRQSILNKINDLWHTSSDKTVMDNVSFRSGINPGAMEYDNAHTGTIMDYDSSTGSLTFTNENVTSDEISWSRYYAAQYTLTSGKDGNMTTTDTEIRIENSYDPLIKIKKVSDSLNGETLSGAKFRLYKLDGNGNKLYYTAKSTHTNPDWLSVDVSKEENTVNERNVSSDKALSFTSNSDGIVTIGAVDRNIDSNGKYADTDYYLEEYEAPGGYNRVQISFRVKADGTVQILDKDKEVQSTIESSVTWDDPYYMLTIVDKAGYILPVTGGTGIALFTMMGALLIAIAGVLYAKKKVNQNIQSLQK